MKLRMWSGILIGAGILVGLHVCVRDRGKNQPPADFSSATVLESTFLDFHLGTKAPDMQSQLLRIWEKQIAERLKTAEKIASFKKDGPCDYSSQVPWPFTNAVDGLSYWGNHRFPEANWTDMMFCHGRLCQVEVKFPSSMTDRDSELKYQSIKKALDAEYRTSGKETTVNQQPLERETVWDVGDMRVHLSHRLGRHAADWPYIGLNAKYRTLQEIADKEIERLGDYPVVMFRGRLDGLIDDWKRQKGMVNPTNSRTLRGEPLRF